MQSRFNLARAGSALPGADITVIVNGDTLTASAAQFDFEGAGVNDDGSSGSNVTINIPGTAQGLLAARPAAAPANSGEVYYATDTPGTGIGTLYLSDGATWTTLTTSSGGSGGLTLSDHTNEFLLMGA